MGSSSANVEARRYTNEELLRMRTSLPVVNCVIKKLNKHPNIATVVRLPEEAFRNPDRFSCESRNLVDITNTRKSQQQSKRNVVQSSKESGDSSISGTQTLRDCRQVQWSLRRRDSSDRSSQPHSAPSSLAAQNSEKFQRFYRAVVSPTHVRVTAGGRIVPNTRTTASPSPAYEWNGDKLHFEPRQQVPEVDVGNLQADPWLHNAPPPLGFPPLIPAGFVPPYRFLPQLNSLPIASMASQAPRNFSGGEQISFEGDQAPKFNREYCTGLLQPDTILQSIKISPPTQFDQTKPFMYNGHVVYPVPAGFQPLPNALPVPIAMLGNPSFPHGAAQPPPAFFPPQFPMPLTNLPNPMMFPVGQPLPMMMQHPSQMPENMPHPAPYLPPPGMVPVSNLTRSQIQGLRNHLNFIDNQITNNKHQVDETYMNNQRVSVMVQIEIMENILNAQLTQDGHAQVDGMGAKSKGSFDHTSATKQEEPTSSVDAQIQVPNGKSQNQPLATADEPASTSKAPKNEETGATGIATETKPDTRSETASKSRLSAAAAMAPPFQPLAQVLAAQPQAHLANDIANVASGSLTELIPFETQTQIETRLLAKDSTNWGRSGEVVAAPGHASLSRAHTLHDPSGLTIDRVQPPAFQQSNTFHSQTSVLLPLNNGPIISPQAVPYLVGTLPQGVQASEVKPADLVYPRPLTDEEIRARYLYWGKTPRHIQSGLPKFDGKDFYPPSPVKEFTRLAVSNDINSTISRRATPVPLLDFTQLFTEPGVPGYKNPSPLRNSTSLQNLVEPTSQPFLTNGVRGYATLSPRKSTHRPESSIFDGWAKTQPMTPTHPVTQGSAASPNDFSHLFLERGVPGYKSPSPLRPDTTTANGLDVGGGEIPVTPNNSKFPKTEGEDDEMGTPGSWAGPTGDSDEALKNGANNDSSTVEIHLSPQTKSPPKRLEETASFAERVAKFSNAEQQTLFLQNMLKNTPQVTMAGTAVSGTVSSATAQGYLPQYRGSAAASLAPTILNIGAERDVDQATTKVEPWKESNITGPLVVSSILSENHPLKRERSHRAIRPSPDGGAEAYLRFLSPKPEQNETIIEQGWNANTTATGPVMGSDW